MIDVAHEDRIAARSGERLGHNGPMQRLVEQPSDNGQLFEGTVRLGRVHYHLSVYQHFSSADNDPVPAHLEVEGRIVPLDQLDLVDLHRRGSELTLRLADGRALDCSMSDGAGLIRSTGRGLYRA
jgi:hypothetical protein